MVVFAEERLLPELVGDSHKHCQVIELSLGN